MNPLELGATFQIPRFEASAELLLSDNRRLKGKLFLPILPSSKLGHSTVIDSLNEPQRFFPFFSEKSNQVEIFNKDILVEVVVDIDVDQDDTSTLLNSNFWIEQIEVQCSTYVSVTGNVILDLPPNRARVLDFFNLPAAFFSLQDGKNTHIINKKYVTNIRELSFLPPPATQPVVTKKTRATKAKATKAPAPRAPRKKLS
jgi:hypothetical protein